MKKIVRLFSFLSMIILSVPVVADPSQQIYCPSQIICRGTAESCYVDIPKNYDGNFVWDTHQRDASDPHGRYVFTKAKSNVEAFCEYTYVDGSTDPHAAVKISYENKIRMKAQTPNRNWSGSIDNLECVSYINHDPTQCPFVPKP